MDHDEAKRKIGALKAIIQTLMPELYLSPGKGAAKANFYELLEDQDPIATSIANELTESEIDEAFDWVRRAIGGAEAEMSATPIVPYLNPEQAERFRVQLEAIV